MYKFQRVDVRLTSTRLIYNVYLWFLRTLQAVLC